jgi:putative membrane protein
VRYLDDDARTALTKAIETIEGCSSIEVVVASRRRSAGYGHASAIAGAIVAFAGLAAMLFAEHAFSLTAILVDPFVVGALAALAVRWLPDVQRVLTPPAWRERAVAAAAHATFVERGVHNTRDRSGLLVYVSWLEQRVVLVPDSGLAAAVSPEELARCNRLLSDALRDGGAAVARALVEHVIPIAPAMRRRPDDVNELPDSIDEGP